MKLRNAFLIRLAAWLAVRSMQWLVWTCRVEYRSPDPKTRLDCDFGPDVPERYIVPVWHDLLLFPTFVARRNDLCCGLVSRHEGASFLSAAIEILGGHTIRGSSRKGGATAVKQMIEQSAGYHILITPDGPMGPRRETKQGVIYLASSLGRRVIPTAYHCSNAWRIRGSWTDLVIPKPFSKIIAVSGEALVIPPDLSREELTEWTSRLQVAMDDLHAELEVSAGRTPAQEAPPHRAAA